MAAKDARQERAAHKRAQILHVARALFIITVTANQLTQPTTLARPVQEALTLRRTTRHRARARKPNTTLPVPGPDTHDGQGDARP